MRRYRQRRAFGIRIINVPVSDEAIQAWVDGDIVEGRDDVEGIRGVIAEIVEEYAYQIVRDA